MSSMTETVIAAVVARIIEALPFAEVTRNQDKPNGIPAGGWVNIHDGDPGEPEVVLGPLTYTYDHRIPIEVMGYESETQTREQVLDQLLKPIGDAIAADPYLNQLADYVRVTAAAKSGADLFGADHVGLAQFDIIATYTTQSPLG